MADDRQKLNRAQKALTWVKARLRKRRERVNWAHDKKVYWNKESDRLHKLHKDKAAHEAVLKAAYFREQEDKAILGRKKYNQRRKEIAKKVRVLTKKVEKDNDLPSAGVTVADKPWNPSRRPIANWIIPWLDKVWAVNVRFSVTSGYRSDAYQCQVCRGVCGNCGGCAGTCAAPGTSNHRGTAYPLGAVDVTNYYAVEAALARVGAPLRNNLGSRDPVHMSATGY